MNLYFTTILSKQYRNPFHTHNFKQILEQAQARKLEYWVSYLWRTNLLSHWPFKCSWFSSMDFRHVPDIQPNDCTTNKTCSNQHLHSSIYKS